MPYRCVHCAKLYEDGSKEVLTGCSECKGKFFFYIRKEKLEEKNLEEEKIELTEKEKKKIENDVREIAGLEDEETPIFLDFESIKVIRHGKYLIDLTKLFSNTPKIYHLEDGKYIIDLSPFTLKEESKS